MKLRYTAGARDDIDLALAWYERQRRGLGLEFLDCVEAAVASIQDNPRMYRIRYSCFRCCVIHRFPYFDFLYDRRRRDRGTLRLRQSAESKKEAIVDRSLPAVRRMRGAIVVPTTGTRGAERLTHP